MVGLDEEYNHNPSQGKNIQRIQKQQKIVLFSKNSFLLKTLINDSIEFGL